MNTSIYQEVEAFATEFKKKIQGARARREITALAAQKSNEEMERKCCWFYKKSCSVAY